MYSGCVLCTHSSADTIQTGSTCAHAVKMFNIVHSGPANLVLVHTIQYVIILNTLHTSAARVAQPGAPARRSDALEPHRTYGLAPSANCTLREPEPEPVVLYEATLYSDRASSSSSSSSTCTRVVLLLSR